MAFSNLSMAEPGAVEALAPDRGQRWAGESEGRLGAELEILPLEIAAVVRRRLLLMAASQLRRPWLTHDP